MTTEVPQYTKKDFVSSQDPRWCPGCGDYSVLAAIQIACTKIGRKKEDITFISGIGCSSRFPYYMDTYGIHGIHGRAPAIASGVKLNNPDLSVWIITGDGDGLSIGGNHFIHAIRRNINLNIIIFNNEIYGLTKGQYSPTSAQGIVTKSSPFGAVDLPFSPASLSLGAGSTFFARTVDTDVKHMNEIFQKAEAHEGVSVVEVLQNCVIFNHGVHKDVTDKAVKEDNTIKLEHGKPMIFGAEKNKGIMVNGAEAQVVEVNESTDQSKLLTHNENANSPFIAHLLSSFHLPDLPIPLGVFRSVQKATYEKTFYQQSDDVVQKFGRKSMRDLLESGDTWKVQ